MKKHRVTPLEVMELEFLDRKIIFNFNMRATTKLQEKFGDIEEAFKGKDEYEMAAVMLWAGVKDDDFTLEEAEVIVTSSVDALVDTLTLTKDNIMKLAGESNVKKIQEEIEKALMKAKNQ